MNRCITILHNMPCEQSMACQAAGWQHQHVWMAFVGHIKRHSAQSVDRAVVMLLQAAAAEQRRVQVLAREEAAGGTASREGTPAPEDDEEDEEDEDDDATEVRWGGQICGASKLERSKQLQA